MKLIAYVETFAGEAMVRLHGGKEGLFFAGKQPAQPSLITLDLPGLTRMGIAIREWLVAYHNKRRKPGTQRDRRRQRVDLVETLWRPTVLDDFIDAKNGYNFVWYVAQFFTVEEIATFCAAHGPKLHRDVLAALTIEREARPRALLRLVGRAGRIVPVMSQGTSRLHHETEALKIELDREDAAELVTSEFAARAWIKATRRLRTDGVKREVLADIGKQLVAHGADIGGALDLMIAAKLDKVDAPEMWQHIAPHLELRQNVRGKTLDLTTAREMTAAAGWELWTAKRVGPVKPGRAVLVLAVGHTVYYVRGERKLKHAIRARGGSIMRWGCKLVVGGRAGAAAVHAKLLEVDKIDTLAQLDPRRAVALVSDTHPADPAIATALARSVDDPRWRRVLADLLIERLVGIDADVARRLARTEATANRR